MQRHRALSRAASAGGRRLVNQHGKKSVRAADAERKLAISEASQNAQKTIAAKDSQLADLRHWLDQQKNEHALALEAKNRIPLLTLLRNAASNSLAYREEAEMLRNQHFDVQQFAGKLNDFKTKFGKSYGAASKQIESAVEEIDKTIAHLEKTKKALQLSSKHLDSANTKAEDMTLKKLTRGNRTMQKKFKDAVISIAEPVELPHFPAGTGEKIA